MRRASTAALMFLTAAATAVAAPPPFNQELSDWAKAEGFALSAFRNCSSIEEKYFGSLGSVCWDAKRTTPTTATSRTFPRIALTLAVFADEKAAQERMARFHEVPAALAGARGKEYPLRAGFRVGHRVILVTTDAFAFEHDAYAAAAALAKRLDGTELTCWTRCTAGG